MKTNHIPVIERLHNKIAKLQSKLENGIISTRKRFYSFCKYCDRDIISINMYGHYDGCQLRGIDKQIVYYKGLLETSSVNK